MKLILFRSLTYAQRAVHLLRRAGISGRIVRTPQVLAGGGCGYAVRLSESTAAFALEVLQKERFPIVRVYSCDGQGGYREVAK